MEKLNLRLASCRQALTTLAEAIHLPFSIIVRDACIQRFEYSFESLWKLLKLYLGQFEGLICNSPKGCFREAFQVGLLDHSNAELCLRMTDSRNLTSHTYLETIAENIYQQLPAYLAVMQLLLANIEQRMSLEE